MSSLGQAVLLWSIEALTTGIPAQCILWQNKNRYKQQRIRWPRPLPPACNMLDLLTTVTDSTHEVVNYFRIGHSQNTLLSKPNDTQAGTGERWLSQAHSQRTVHKNLASSLGRALLLGIVEVIITQESNDLHAQRMQCHNKNRRKPQRIR